MPLRILGVRSLITANLVRGFLVTGAFSTFFLGSLYLEHVRGIDPIQIGLAFLAMSVALATMSAGLAARLVARFGPKRTLIGGHRRARRSGCCSSRRSASPPPTSR